VSVSAKFREQLNALMKTLDKTRPTFVRCIKPNNDQAPRKKI
jgi:myosin-5